MSFAGPPNLPPDDNIGNRILEVVWIEAAIAIIVVIARVYTRIKIIRNVGWDDYLMITSLILAIIAGVLSTRAVHWGFGRHIFYLDPIQQKEAIKFQYLAQPFSNMAQACGRASFAVFLVKVMGTTKTRLWILYFMALSQFVLNVIFCILELCDCRPIAKYWDPLLPGTCWGTSVIEISGYVSQAWNVLTDFILAVFPGAMISQLNMRLPLKVGLIVLMGLGLFNMAAAIVTTVLTKSITSNGDITYAYVVLDIWGTIQTYLVIIAASIPTIRPLFTHLTSQYSRYFSLSLYRFGKSSSRSPGAELAGSASSSRKEMVGHDESGELPQVNRSGFVTTTLQGHLASNTDTFR